MEISIRDFAQVIGKMIAAETGVLYAPLFYKSLEIEKDLRLKENVGTLILK